MAQCELVETCLFFNDLMGDHRHLSAIYKMSYCRGDNSRCARYMVYRALGRAHVPADLYPSDTLRAMEITGNKRIFDSA
jgi:hypothetical protein